MISRVLLLLCSSSALSVLSRRGAARRSADLAAFDRWWRLRGADGSVAWSADAGGAGVRGGVATRDLSPGDVVLTVPLSLVLAVPLDDRVGTDSRGLWMAPDERLAARLLAARDAARVARPHGDASVGHLGPWIDLLPTARAFRRQLPQHWGVRKLRVLDHGAPEVASDAREIAAYRRARRAQLRDHVRRRRREGARDTAALRTDLLERAARADGDSWQWALDVVGTRGGTVTIAGTEAFALVPGVEMLNHDPRLPPEGTRCDIVWPDSRAPPPTVGSGVGDAAAWWRLCGGGDSDSPDDGAVDAPLAVLSTSHATRAGREVRISYGDLSPHALLLRHGMLFPGLVPVATEVAAEDTK